MLFLCPQKITIIYLYVRFYFISRVRSFYFNGRQKFFSLRPKTNKNAIVRRFYIKKTHAAEPKYAPFACVFMVRPSGLEPEPKASEAFMVSNSTTGAKYLPQEMRVLNGFYKVKRA